MEKLVHLRSFCFIYTAQVGIVTSSCVGLTITAIATVVNIAAEDPETNNRIFIVRRIVFGVFIILCFIGFGAGLLSVLNDQDLEFSRRLALIASVLLVIVIIYWLTLTIICLTTSPCSTRYICMHNRCADRWFIQASGRNVNPPRHSPCPGDVKSLHSGFIIGPRDSVSHQKEGNFPPMVLPSDTDESLGPSNENETYGHEVKKYKCFSRFTRDIICIISIVLIFVYLVYSSLIFFSYVNTIDMYFVTPELPTSKSITLVRVV